MRAAVGRSVALSITEGGGAPYVAAVTANSLARLRDQANVHLRAPPGRRQAFFFGAFFGGDG